MKATPKLFCSFFLMCFIFFGSLNGQKPPIKFGKIDIADLEMKVYPLDTTAAAVILCDYGNFDPNQFMFTRTLRVKILKKEGTSLANMVIPVTQKSLVRGRTYNLVDGEIVEEKLKNESIFREQITGTRFEIRLGMPDVRVGSIFEITYSMSTIPGEWKFQDDIPVRYSELRLPDHEYLSLQKNFTGYEPFSFSNNWRWVAENMPAFQPEPYINSTSNYIRKVELEIGSISIPGQVFQDYTSSWNAVNKYFYESLYFGEIGRGVFLHLSDDAKRIESTCSTDREKIIAAVETIRNNVQWDERNRLYPYTNLNFIYNNKKIGSSADINFLLLQLLKKLDLDAYPMVLSTRDNGMVYEYFPTVDGFNYVIVYVKTGNEYYCLDATDRFCPAGKLPLKCLNGRGLAIMNGRGQWIDLPQNTPSSRVIYCDMSLDENGEIKGALKYQRSDYLATSFRKHLAGFNSTEEYLDEFEKNNGGLEITDFSIENEDSINYPITANYQVEISNKAMVMGEDIYLDPILFGKISENPFRIEERDYPVDFTYPVKTMYIAKFIIPDGYTISELPEACRMTLQNKSVNFSYGVTPMENMIQVMFQFIISKPVFYQPEYKELKEIYNQVVNKLAEPIILKKAENEG